MWPFGIDARINRRLAAWEYRRAQEMDLSGHRQRIEREVAAKILRDAEKPLLCAQLFKGARMGGRPIRSCVYAKLEDVPRRPAYAIGECVSTPFGKGRVDRSHVGHCGPNGGYMWVYDLWMYGERVPCARDGVWEEDIRPLAREG